MAATDAGVVYGSSKYSGKRRYDTNKPTEFLKCEFTDAEITDLAKELAAANNTRAALEQQKKEVDAQLKADIEAQNSSIGRLSRLISNGWEMRTVDIRIDLDVPDMGKKRIVRLDTGEEVAVKVMTDQDRQMVIDLQEQAAAERPVVDPMISDYLNKPDSGKRSRNKADGSAE